MPKRGITNVKKHGRGTVTAPYRGLWEKKETQEDVFFPRATQEAVYFSDSPQKPQERVCARETSKDPLQLL